MGVWNGAWGETSPVKLTALLVEIPVVVCNFFESIRGIAAILKAAVNQKACRKCKILCTWSCRGVKSWIQAAVDADYCCFCCSHSSLNFVQPQFLCSELNAHLLSCRFYIQLRSYSAENLSCASDSASSVARYQLKSSEWATICDIYFHRSFFFQARAAKIH